jgi:outer membrane immunogenic protein
MKKLLLGTVGLIALGVAPALAADLPARTYTKAPAYVAAVYDWSGFYIGANGGYGSSRKCWDFAGFVTARNAVNLNEGCHDATGGVAGGQIGYNWQVASWVFGIEAQGDWADLTGTNVSLQFPAFTNRTKIDALGFFTGRVGYAWNNALLYVKGGAAVASDKYNYYPTVTGITTASASETRWGAVVGAGFEYGFTPNWSFAVEYDHAFLGARDLTFSPAGVPATQVVQRIKQDVDLVTARINYRWGGPVVAKY